MHCAAFEVEPGSATSSLCPGPSRARSLFPSIAFVPGASLPAKAAEIWFTYVTRVPVHGFPARRPPRREHQEIGPSISCLLFAAGGDRAEVASDNVERWSFCNLESWTRPADKSRKYFSRIYCSSVDASGPFRGIKSNEVTVAPLLICGVVMYLGVAEGLTCAEAGGMTADLR